MFQNLTPVFQTALGCLYVGDSLKIIQSIPTQSIDLILSSPPFSLDRDAGSNDLNKGEFLEWMLKYMTEFGRVMVPNGSVVLELGNTWSSHARKRSIHNYQLIVKLCSDGEWHLIQEFYWYNPDSLPTPKIWVEDEHIRFHNSISTIWWLSKLTNPQVDNRLILYNNSLTTKFSNLLLFADSLEDNCYLDRCHEFGLKPHPDRFPTTFPDFFIRLLTDKNGTVLDPFAGSCTTGAAAESLGRSWICIEKNNELLKTAHLRFNILQ